MKVKVRPLRKEGRLLVSSDNTLQMPKFSGVLSVVEKKDSESGRTLSHARLTGMSTGIEADLLPELMDVRLLWVRDGELRMTGFERISKVEYAQTWSVEVVAC